MTENANRKEPRDIEGRLAWIPEEFRPVVLNRISEVLASIRVALEEAIAADQGRAMSRPRSRKRASWKPVFGGRP